MDMSWTACVDELSASSLDTAMAVCPNGLLKKYTLCAFGPFWFIQMLLMSAFALQAALGWICSLT